MRRRPAVTLLEVLVAIFIMAIGMLALLVLFPLGALSMADALKNDRSAAAANEATSLADAFDVRHDPTLANYYTQPFGNAYVGAFPDGPSYPVLVDPYYAPLSATVGTYGGANATPGLPRVMPGVIPPPAGGGNVAARWFTLLDDVTFNKDGTPDLSSGGVARGGRFTWAYLLRRPRAGSDAVVDLSVVVFSNRPTGLVSGEQPFAAAGTAGTTSLTLNYTAATGKPNVKRGGWILDSSYDVMTVNNMQVARPDAPPVHGYFYRVVGVTENPAAGTMTVEVQTPLKADVQVAVVMEYVAEVFDKGPGWAP
jgi:hypothetical protein